MSGSDAPPAEPRHDRSLLLYGAKRNLTLTLREVQRYGIDSFGDADHVRLYGMTPDQWYARGIRLLGRTAVECTQDELADAIGRDIATAAAALPPGTPVTVIDPFAGSCNTLYWILRHLPDSVGIACELDPLVRTLTQQNIAGLDRRIELSGGDYRSVLERRRVPEHHAIVAFLAPPWGTALDERSGLDLRRTTPPVPQIVADIARRYAAHPILYAIQVYEVTEPDGIAHVQRMLDWSRMRIYTLASAGGDHGVLLGAHNWPPYPCSR